MKKRYTVFRWRVCQVIALVFGLMLGASALTAGTLTYTYDAAGRITGVNYGNTTNTSYVYDNNGSLIQETTAASTDANISISKSAAAGPVMAGSPLAYRILLTNSGPDTASGVVVSDTLPFGVWLASAAASQGHCATLGRTVTCDLGVMAPGASAMVSITVVPAFSAVFTNVASVALNQIDGLLGDNTDDAETIVSAAVDRDGDDLPDWWETLHFGGPTNAVKHADSDGDGVLDGDEYISDTDPHDAADFLAVTEITQPSSTLLNWNSSPIRSYALQFTAHLTNGTHWLDLDTGIEGTGLIMSGVDTNSLIPRRIYRIKANVP